MGEGEFTDDPLETFGGAGVVQIPRLQELLRYICEHGFEHHVAANLATVARRFTKLRRDISAGACFNMALTWAGCQPQGCSRADVLRRVRRSIGRHMTMAA